MTGAGPIHGSHAALAILPTLDSPLHSSCYAAAGVSGWYDLIGKLGRGTPFSKIEGLQFALLRPSRHEHASQGHHHVSSRVLRHFNVMYCDASETNNLTQIYRSILETRFAECSEEVRPLLIMTTAACLFDVFERRSNPRRAGLLHLHAAVDRPCVQAGARSKSGERRQSRGPNRHVGSRVLSTYGGMPSRPPSESNSLNLKEVL